MEIYCLSSPDSGCRSFRRVQSEFEWPLEDMKEH